MNMGRVIDIRRFSIHDGSGIRTTIFMKGCPLNCCWCQNPEGISTEVHLLYFKNKCIHCKRCIDKCHVNALSMNESNNVVIDKATCNLCGICVEECPTNALVFDSKSYTVDELVEIILEDEVFFSLGGGVTLSGGEPFMQSNFVLNLLINLKRKNIHTAIETSLFTSIERISQIIPYIDEFFCDFKLYNDQEHMNDTGVGNEKIKRNLKYLLTSDHKDKVIVRTPLIPEFTANENNIINICKFISTIYPEVKYELLNYNPLAQSKYHLIDKEYCFKTDNPRMYTKEEMMFFQNIAIKAGIKNLVTI